MMMLLLIMLSKDLVFYATFVCTFFIWDFISFDHIIGQSCNVFFCSVCAHVFFMWAILLVLIMLGAADLVFFLQCLCACMYMSDFVSFNTVGCCWSSVFRSIGMRDFMCIILLVVIELSVVLIMYNFFEENNEIMKNESILVNGLKTHDSWDMCLCSLQTRALKSGTCQQPNFSKLQKPNVFCPRTLCNWYCERDRKTNVVQSAKGMQTWHFFFPSSFCWCLFHKVS